VSATLRGRIGIPRALLSGVGDLLREFDSPFDGDGEPYAVRVYGSEQDGVWEAWVEFASLRTGELRRSGITTTAASRDELARWADRLAGRELARALEDAELGRVSELGTPPPLAGHPSPMR